MVLALDPLAVMLERPLLVDPAAGHAAQRVTRLGIDDCEVEMPEEEEERDGRRGRDTVRSPQTSLQTAPRAKTLPPSQLAGKLIIKSYPSVAAIPRAAGPR